MHDDVIADVIIFCWRHQFYNFTWLKKKNFSYFWTKNLKMVSKNFDFFLVQKGRGHGRLGSNFEKTTFEKVV